MLIKIQVNSIGDKWLVGNLEHWWLVIINLIINH